MGALLGVASQLRPPRVSFDQLILIGFGESISIPAACFCLILIGFGEIILPAGVWRGALL